jgi:hypothetical protein
MGNADIPAKCSNRARLRRRLGPDAVIDRHRDRLDPRFVPGEMFLEQKQKRKRVASAGNGGNYRTATGKIDPRERGRASRPARTI